MKIAFLAYSSLPLVGGAQVFLHNIVRELLDRSHEIHLFLPYRYYKLYSRINRDRRLRVRPILFFEGFIGKYFSFMICFRLLCQQMINKYDIWQVIGAYPAGFVSRFLSKIVPVVLRSHGDDIQKDVSLNYGSRLDSSIERKIISTVSQMTRLVALTDTVKECYKDLGVAPEKIVKIPNGVDLEIFRHAVDRKRIRAAAGVHEKELFILSIGRYHVKKGYEFIPKAAKILKGKGYDFKWIIIGKGVERLKNAVEKMGVENSVILMKEVGLGKKIEDYDKLSMPPRALKDLYKSADILVMPSMLETFGMVLIEAMASGLVIVTTDAPGCRDVVAHEVTGLQSRSGDVHDLVSQIEKILTVKDLAHTLKSNALDKVKEFDWPNVAQRYEELFDSLLSPDKEPIRQPS